MHKKDQILIPKAEMEKGVRCSNLDWALKMLIIPCFFFFFTMEHSLRVKCWLNILINIISFNIVTPWSWCYFDLHFIDEEIMA